MRKKKTELFIVEKILADKTLFRFEEKKQIDVLNSFILLLLLVHFHKRQKFAGEQKFKKGAIPNRI
jgi:hypothetical protein